VREGQAQERRLTPEQERKVRAIEAALDASDRALRDHFTSLATFERSALKVRTGRISPQWIATLSKLEAELGRMRARLDGLHTGLRAQRRLRDALTAQVSAVAAWREGLASNQLDEVDAALERMRRHAARATALGKAGLADLEAGR
jgi:hypothetical protein